MHLSRQKLVMTLVTALALSVLFPAVLRGGTNQVVLYSTGFEVAEGYNPDYSLAGQNDWVANVVGGNGLVTNFFDGQGQQAFIGYAPLPGTNDSLSVWRPINFVPGANQASVVQFSVWFTVVDSTNRLYDDFRWSIYNTNGNRLFTVDLDNNALVVSYALDDGAGFISTGVKYTNSVIYILNLRMDFGQNTWSADLDGQLLASDKPITTQHAALNLGDIDAVWAIRTPGAPGNNYMVFDNYLVTLAHAPPAAAPPSLTALGPVGTSGFLLRLTGVPHTRYAIEATTNWVDWSALKTNSTASDGTFDFLDITAPAYPTSFYRARRVSP